MDLLYIKIQLPTLNNVQLSLILADVYFQIELSDNEEYILDQLEIAELIEGEVNIRKYASQTY